MAKKKSKLIDYENVDELINELTFANEVLKSPVIKTVISLCSENKDVIDEIIKAKKELQDEKKALGDVKTRSELENRIKELEENLTINGQNIEEQLNIINDLTLENSDLAERVKELTANVTELTNKRDELAQKLENKDREIVDRLNNFGLTLESLDLSSVSDSSKITDIIEEIKSQISETMKSTSSSAGGIMIVSDEEKEELKRKVEELEGKLAALNTDGDGDTSTINALNKALDRLNSELNASDKKYHDLQEEYADDVLSLQDEIKKLTEDLKILKSSGIVDPDAAEEIKSLEAKILFNEYQIDLLSDDKLKAQNHILNLKKELNSYISGYNYDENLINLFTKTLRDAGVLEPTEPLTNTAIEILLNERDDLAAKSNNDDQILATYINSFQKRGLFKKGFNKDTEKILNDPTVPVDEKIKIIETTAKKIRTSGLVHKIAAGVLGLALVGVVTGWAVDSNNKNATINEQQTTIVSLENQLDYFTDGFTTSTEAFADFIKNGTAISADAKAEINSLINSLQHKMKVVKDAEGNLTVEYEKDAEGKLIKESDELRLALAENLTTMLNGIENLNVSGGKYTDDDIKSFMTVIMALESTKSLYSDMVEKLNNGTLSEEEFAKLLEDSGELKIAFDFLDETETAAVEKFNELQNKYELIKDKDGNLVVIEKEHWLSTSTVFEMASKYYTMEKSKDNYMELVNEINSNICTLLEKFLSGETITAEDLENAKKLENLSESMANEYADKFGDTEGFMPIADSISSIVENINKLGISKEDLLQKLAVAEENAANEKAAREAAEALANEYVETLKTIVDAVDSMFAVDENGNRTPLGKYTITDENGFEKEVEASEYLQKTLGDLVLKLGDEVYSTLGSDLSKLAIKVVVSDEDAMNNSLFIRVFYEELTGINPDNMTDDQIRAYLIEKFNLDLDGNGYAPTTPGENDEAKQPGKN